MLIIFDLDDTLIPTTSQISPYKLDQLVRKIPEINADDLLLKVNDLKRINRAAFGSKEAISEYLAVNDICQEKQMQILSDFSHDQSLPIELIPFEGADIIISNLSSDHTLALVTRGKTSYQEKKIESIKDIKKFFKKIEIVEKGSKKQAYSHLQQLFQKSNHEVVVIGDRIDLDLLPAKELGFYTVLMKSMRSRSYFQPKEGIVDYQICSLMALSAIMDEIELRNFLRKI